MIWQPSPTRSACGRMDPEDWRAAIDAYHSVEYGVVAQHREMTFLELACRSLSILAQPFPEYDWRAVLALANMAAEPDRLFVGEPVGRAVRLAS
jgi:hypothetical protein